MNDPLSEKVVGREFLKLYKKITETERRIIFQMKSFWEQAEEVEER